MAAEAVSVPVTVKVYVPLAAKDVGAGVEAEPDPELEQPEMARPETVSRTRALNAAILRERMLNNPINRRLAKAMLADARFEVGDVEENDHVPLRHERCEEFSGEMAGCSEGAGVAALALGLLPGAVTAPTAAQEVELL